MTDVGTGVTAGGGVAGVAAGMGLVPGGKVDLGVVTGGPFVTAVLSDNTGGVIAVVGVVDGDTADDAIGVLAAAAAAETGGTAAAGEAVAAAGDLAGLFDMPVTVEVFAGPTGETQVVYVSGAERRTQDTRPTATAGGGVRGGGLDKLINVALEVSVELGRTRVTLADVLDYDVGSIIELDRAAGAPVDIRVNDTLLAQGEVVLIDDEYAVRITAIIEPHQT